MIKYAQVTFGKSKRLYTFKVKPTISLTEHHSYEIIADDTSYSTPVKIEKLLDTPPRGLEGIYLKEINFAKLQPEKSEEVKEEEKKIKEVFTDTNDFSFI